MSDEAQRGARSGAKSAPGPLEKASPIVIAEDDPAVRGLLTRLLRREGYTAIHAVATADEVLPACRQARAHLLLLDLHLGDASGFDVLEALQADSGGTGGAPTPQVIVLTGDLQPSSRHRALSSGAADFVTKPLDHVEVLLRVRNLVRMRLLSDALQEQNQQLEAMVLARTAELDRAQMEIIERLARAAEHRDDDTGHHTRRVADLSYRLAQRLGLDDAEAELIRRGAMLHDVGKIGLADAVLLKPGSLTQEERAMMQRHTSVGAAILAGSEVRLLQVAEQIARSHHEHWDGAGYPDGLRGEAIPLAARIVSVADTYDALTNERPYKAAWSHADAMTEIRGASGTQFDPAVVALLDGATLQ